MWELDISALELIFRGAAVYAVLLLMLRIGGKRTVGQFTPFDLLVVMLVSEAAGPSMTGKDQSFGGGLLVCFVLIALNAAAGYITARSKTMEKLLEGEAILLGRNGVIFDATRKKHRLSQNDIDQALRVADCDLKDLRYAFLESDGCISIQKVKDAQ